jgi:NTP pyrophosphatase (non-canonical NTP hydrolase)
MNLDEYQQLALKTGDNVKLDEYQDAAISTAIYPGKLAYPALGLAGEAGELMAVCLVQDEDNIVKEVGDVLWYVANVAHDAGLSLSDVGGRKTFSWKNSKRLCWDSVEACEYLAVHVGKVAENVKKTIRDNAGELTDARLRNIKKALCDIIQLLACVALDGAGVTLEKCAELNIDKLKSRQERGKLGGDGDDR